MFQQSMVDPSRLNLKRLGDRMNATRNRGGRLISDLRSSAPDVSELRRVLPSVPTARRLRDSGRRLTRRSRRQPRRWRQAASIGTPFLAGAVLMFLFDPRMGRRRRALVRDKSVAAYHLLTRRIPGATRKRGIWMRDRVRGIGYELRHAVSGNGHRASDDVDLAQRVRTEVFRDPRIPDGAIVVDAYEGVITLRGEVPDQDMIERVVERTESVEGVRQVRSLLHLPKTPPPNKPDVGIPGGIEPPRGYDERA